MSGLNLGLTGNESLALSKRYTQEVVEGHGFIQGKSAYEIAVENGFVGTEQEWLESLEGAPGPEGPEGPQGPQGEKGEGSVFFEDIGNETVIAHY